MSTGGCHRREQGISSCVCSTLDHHQGSVYGSECSQNCRSVLHMHAVHICGQLGIVCHILDIQVLHSSWDKQKIHRLHASWWYAVSYHFYCWTHTYKSSIHISLLAGIPQLQAGICLLLLLQNLERAGENGPGQNPWDFLVGLFSNALWWCGVLKQSLNLQDSQFITIKVNFRCRYFL